MNTVVLVYDDGKVCYRDTGVEYSIPPKITFTKHCFPLYRTPSVSLFSLPLIVHGQKNKNSIYFIVFYLLIQSLTHSYICIMIILWSAIYISVFVLAY
jgi:hypothetical protein